MSWALLLALAGFPLPVAADCGPPPQGSAAEGVVIDLLRNDLVLWYHWIGVPYKGLRDLSAGTPVGDGKTGVPLGVDGLDGVFSLIVMDAEPVLRVSGEVYGALTTRAHYANYHLQLQYKWGTAKHPPRPQAEPRGSGLLFHLTGTNEDSHWSAFMMGLEFQIAEGKTGDLLFMPNKDSSLVPSVRARTADRQRWSPNAQPQLVGGFGRDTIFKAASVPESKAGEWTRVDLYVVGDAGVFFVNGRSVMAWDRATLAQPGDPEARLTSGRVQIESEGSEVYYRRVTLRPITALPAWAAGVR